MAAVTVHSYLVAQENKICHCFHFSPSVCLEVMGLDARTYNNAFSRKSYKWNHKVCGFLSLASFPWCNAFELHPCCCLYLIFLLCSIPLYKYTPLCLPTHSPATMIDMWVFPLWGYYESSLYEHPHPGLCVYICYISLMEIIRSGVAGRCAQCTFNFIGNCHTVCQVAALLHFRSP